LANALVIIEQLPEEVGSDLMLTAQEAFTQGFSVAAIVSAVILMALSVLSWRMFRNIKLYDAK
jgi:MFS transporter, DHA2 family, multidrug resistance protein